MNEPIFDSRGVEFKFLEKGKDKPVYIVYAKNEDVAKKKLKTYLGKICAAGIFDNMELIERGVENE